jgi:DNA-binding transcriptional ArsR family regulator
MVHRSERLDSGFAVLSDPTRRGILERLAAGDASTTELAAGFDMTLTGMKKHVAVLERSHFVVTRKQGRVRRCSLGKRRLDDETAWIARYQRIVEQRFERLDELLARESRKGD